MMKQLVDKKIEDIIGNKYLHSFYEVMSQIGEQYGPIIIKDGKNLHKKEICERNYIIYISFILGCMYGKEIIDRKEYVNGEITKHFEHFSDEAKEAYEKYKILKIERTVSQKDNKKEESQLKWINVRPDFVIHESHKEDYETTGQKLVVEAKSTLYLDELDFCWDLMKLNFYLDKLKFQNCIYMIVNTSKADIQKMINFYTDEFNYFSNDLSKLWFFVQNQDDNKMLPLELYQLCDKPTSKNCVVRCKTEFAE
jgi:hypothetical protein